MRTNTIPAVVLGGSGYVAAEITRLLLSHPVFRIEAVVSNSNQGNRIDALFPHLAGTIHDMKFSDLDSAGGFFDGKRQIAVFSAMPHGETAPALRELLSKPNGAVKLVDVSADFRYVDTNQFESIYGREHGASELQSDFTCALPDVLKETPEGHLSHPGCFTTAVTLGLAPLVANGLIEPNVQVSAITGSTGAGKQPREGTHHPQRQSAMWAYEPLKHRHVPEMEGLLAALGPKPQIAFVPHSGPFSRGIHATMFATLQEASTADALVKQMADFYAHSPFVTVDTRMPSVKEVVGSNRCHIGVACKEKQVVITSVIDNLVKGAAGGSIQWMNRMFALDETAGLTHAVPGWI